MHPDSAKVMVRLENDTYEVLNAPGLLQHVGPELHRMGSSRKVAVVTDSHVGPLYLPKLRASLTEFEFDVVDAVIPAGEDHKTLEDLLPVYDRLLRHKLDRATVLIGLGGGIVTDMAGFVAATILRGVRLVQIPTSLLSMVDASVGGKTGVNHSAGKNLIGAFHQPVLVLIDPEVLRTLPPRELRSGLAECIKHEVIRDAEGFASLEKQIHRATAVDVDYLGDLVAHNVAIKARVVEADPLEKGERAHLNFGHTFGHAIETVSNYSYAHGECVALGMVAASRMAAKLGMIDDESVRRIINLIVAAGLPTGGMPLDVQQIVEAMAFDKKVKGGKVRFVLPDRIGHVVIRDDVPAERVREAVESLRG
ncbi:MAG: 3-dehydroquinate synthase [Tepidisphaeraceae bacterium]